MVKITKLFFLLKLLASIFVFVHSQGDTMTPNRTITGSQTLISAGEVFALGFFSPDGSSNKYLGIWYYQIPVPTVVWVASGTKSFKASTAILSLTAQGNLILSSGNENLWSSGTSNVSNPIAQLLDSGNLLIIDGISNKVLWQSFDYAYNTYLAGMRIGVDFRTNLTTQLTSWTTDTDPTPGEYSTKVEIHGVPELYTWRQSTRIWRSGPWTGEGIKINPYLDSSGLFKLEYVSNQSEIYFSVQSLEKSIIARVLLNSTGVLEAYLWPNGSATWQQFATFPTDLCDNYASCGANGICTFVNELSCKCVPGFSANSPQNWAEDQYSNGCTRNIELNCTTDGFWVLKGVKLPATLHAIADLNKNLDECKSWCQNNCSCTAYALSGRTGCLIWTNDFYDIKIFTSLGEDLYVRLAASEIEALRSNATISNNGSSGKTKHVKTIIAIVAGVGLILLVSFALLVYFRRKSNKGKLPVSTISKEDDLDSPLIDLATIKAATNDFSVKNKLGEGGFGPVYKGVLSDGQAIAVKRLSKDSVQGLQEFKTEVSVIAKVQHKNLVRLLGCCVEDEERLLVYEYMQNTSLDSFIFDKRKSALLNLQLRLDIIVGIARGLLYLHQDSRLKIIHRDLKASNILLDEENNPKISDFGMARVLKAGQMKEATTRVVGTYGYMAPEYVVGGIFSTKSDIFSLGVLILEILSGRRSRVINHSTDNVYLLGYAWKLWKEDRCYELLANEVRSCCDMTRVSRFIQVGLLCVQELPDDRPTMFDIILMLNSEAMVLPQPKQPGFFTVGNSSESSGSVFSNEATMSIPEAR